MLWLISAAVASPSTTWASPNKIIIPNLFVAKEKKPTMFLWPTTYPHNPTTPRKRQQKQSPTVVTVGTCSQAWLWTSPFCLVFFLDHETPTRIRGWTIPPKNIWNHHPVVTSFTVRVIIPLSRGEKKKYLNTKVSCVFFCWQSLLGV